MKRIFLFLLLCLPILVNGQALGTEINGQIRPKPYDPNRAGDMFQAIADRVESIVVNGTNTYTVSIPSVTAYSSVQVFNLWFQNANTGSSSLQINALTLKPLRKISSGVSTDLASGDITVGVHQVYFDGTSFIIELGGTGSGGPVSLNAGHLFVGNGSNIATDVALSGDASMSSAGAITVTKINGVSVPAGIYGSQSQNLVWASPSGSSGAATYRAITTLDLPNTVVIKDANSNAALNSLFEGYNTFATAAGTTTLTVGSTKQVYFTGSTTQTVLLPVTSTLILGVQYVITNLSTGNVTVQSSGANTIQILPQSSSLTVTCILTSGTGTASWSAAYNPSLSGSYGGSGTVTSVTSANGNATITNTTTTPQITIVSAPKLTTAHTIGITGDATWTSPSFDGSADVTSSITVTKINGTSLAALGTGIYKNTTGTGIPSIAIAADFPTLNQNTTGTAAGFTTGRTLSISGDMTWTSPSFDGTGNVTAAGTLATVNANTGSFGSSTAIPNFTVNAKGLITAAGTNVVVAPASTLSGTTLNSTVVNSSLTSVGTLANLTVTNIPTFSAGIGSATATTQAVNDNSTKVATTAYADAGGNSLVIVTKTTDYTLALTEATATDVEVNSSSNVNITVPTNASVAFPIGTVIGIDQIGTGGVTIVAAGGVTITASNSSWGLTLAKVQAQGVLKKTGTNTWEFKNGDAPVGNPLTKTDDTNVTLTLGGSPTTALLTATSITVGWTGSLAQSRGGVGAGGVASATTGTQSTDLTNTSVFTITPTGACTFNLSGTEYVGQRTTYVITTSGTSSFTLTWGTGYKTTGTLATGTVSGKVFSVEFVYDGTNMNETSRTTAM